MEVLSRGVTGVMREAIVSVPVAVVLADSGGLSDGDSCFKCGLGITKGGMVFPFTGLAPIFGLAL